MSAYLDDVTYLYDVCLPAQLSDVRIPVLCLPSSAAAAPLWSLTRLVHVPCSGSLHHRLILGGRICSRAAWWLSSSSTTSGVGVILVIRYWPRGFWAVAGPRGQTMAASWWRLYQLERVLAWWWQQWSKLSQLLKTAVDLVTGLINWLWLFPCHYTTFHYILQETFMLPLGPDDSFSMLL